MWCEVCMKFFYEILCTAHWKSIVKKFYIDCIFIFFTVEENDNNKNQKTIFKLHWKQYDRKSSKKKFKKNDSTFCAGEPFWSSVYF